MKKVLEIFPNLSNIQLYFGEQPNVSVLSTEALQEQQISTSTCVVYTASHPYPDNLGK